MLDQHIIPFLVTSGGQSGSMWFASSLHMHPEIMCSVGVDHPLLSLNYDHNKDEMLQLRASIRHGSDLTFGATSILRFALEQGGYYGLNSESPFKGQHREIFTPLTDIPHREGIPITQILFGELAQLPPLKKYKALGNVHGVTASMYAHEIKRGDDAFSGLGNKIAAMDLIRHPIARLDSVLSFYICVDENSGYHEIVKASLADHVATMEAMERRHNIDFSNYANRIFFWIEHVLNHSRGWVSDLKAAPQIPRIPFEKLRSDREYFRKIVHDLTQNKVVADDAYLDKVFLPENLNSGRAAAKNLQKDRKDPKMIFENWPNWWQREIAAIFEKEGLAKYYEPYGYDLSFLKEYV